MRSIRWCLLALPALAGCRARPDPVRLRGELLAADRAFDSAVASRGVEAWVSFFGDSGRQIDRRGDFVVGHAAIRAHMRSLLGDSTRSLRWAPDLADVSGDGSLGYTWGRWTLSGRPDSLRRPLAEGRYLTVWRREPDGSWKAEADIGTETSGD